MLLFFIVLILFFNYNSENKTLITSLLIFGVISLLISIVSTIITKYTLAKFITILIPSNLLLIIGIINLKQTEFLDIFTFLTPKIFALTYIMSPLIFFGLRQKKYLIISLLLLSPSVLFFDSIHVFFGINVSSLTTKFDHYSFFIAVFSFAYSCSLLTILFFQKSNELFRLKLNDQNKKLDISINKLNENIEFAKSLQQSLLPAPTITNNYFSNHTVISIPKDVVSGDFHFAYNLDGTLYFGVADCTGHGVSGSFLAALSSETVKNTINTNTKASTDVILEKIRFQNIERFSNAKEKISESMDVAICSLRKGSNKLQFSGALIDLIIIRNGNKLIDYKATRCPAGPYPKNIPFELNTIDLQKNDMLYIASDGFYDQFGLGKDRTKPQRFKRKNFKKLLLEIAHHDSITQAELLKKALNNWMGNQKQTDDITVFIAKY